MVRNIFAAVIASAAGAAFPAIASAITVQDIGVSPAEIVTISVSNFYTGGAYAGVNKLLIDGVTADGFCIDPFHFSLSSSPGYHFIPLADGPKPPGPMGASNAAEIGKLWALNYSPTMTGPNAAALQIAIWEIAGGDSFSIQGYDYGASQLLVNATTYTGSGADLIGVTGPGQDYVMQRPAPSKVNPVSDGGATSAMLALTFGALLGIGRLQKKERS